MPLQTIYFNHDESVALAEFIHAKVRFNRGDVIFGITRDPRATGYRLTVIVVRPSVQETHTWLITPDEGAVRIRLRPLRGPDLTSTQEPRNA